ncbi:MAG: hypothetical protein HOA61_02735 [Bacteroidetes bacterium]|jgi:hypothetical protein|nr:hypothetical protein [Bacteroidota bacterium]MBT3424185.1 hypothetical protein [Bacteroidota bacterium]MBT4729623.1 hypothetical protein [Bacteroidota bacterium]MBT4970618.1 hypothetical protein [Bacteroidota bacterium]MBT5989775.1 hypothetical protein [Bacteroidota bacterium]
MGLVEYLLIAFYLGLCIMLIFLGKGHRLGPLQIFLVALFLTPIIAAVFILYKKKTSMIYHVNRYKCPRCHYKFDEVLTVCPLCEREGYKMDLEAVNQIMT